MTKLKNQTTMIPYLGLLVFENSNVPLVVTIERKPQNSPHAQIRADGGLIYSDWPIYRCLPACFCSHMKKKKKKSVID